MSTLSYHFRDTFAQSVAEVSSGTSVAGVTDAERFSSFVVRKLDETGLHPQDIVERTGLTRVTVSRHLNGHKLPHYSNRKMYAAFFGMEGAAFERGWRETTAPLTVVRRDPDEEPEVFVFPNGDVTIDVEFARGDYDRIEALAKRDGMTVGHKAAQLWEMAAAKHVSDSGQRDPAARDAPADRLKTLAPAALTTMLDALAEPLPLDTLARLVDLLSAADRADLLRLLAPDVAGKIKPDDATAGSGINGARPPGTPGPNYDPIRGAAKSDKPRPRNTRKRKPKE